MPTTNPTIPTQSSRARKISIITPVWVCFWILAATAGVALAAYFHSATFLVLGAVAEGMVAWNLFRQVRART